MYFLVELESLLFPERHNCGRTGPVVAAGGGGRPGEGSSEGVEGRNMAGAGDRELEAVDVEALLIGVGQKTDKVVFLEAVGGEVGVEIAAGSSYNQSLFQSTIKGQNFLH